MFKKAQSLSMSTIVVAALALLVLSILSLLFIGRMNLARDDLNDCESNGGICVPPHLAPCNNAAGQGMYSQYSVGRELRSYTCTETHSSDHVCCRFA